jgi:GNAT superfamily N-acetyltransferase
MPAILRNLLARAPSMNDLQAVTELRMACDLADYGMPDSTEQDILADWQRRGFNLSTDAWIVVTLDEQVVGYASVRRCEHISFDVYACVHPAYRGRGIGMLLLRLAEGRAREQINLAPPGARVTLKSTVFQTNQAAHQLLEREGYAPARQFWRLIVDLEDDPSESFAEFHQNGKLKLDLVVDTSNLMGTTNIQKRTGIYVARQYIVYEKELRPAVEPPIAVGPGEAMARK